MAASLPTSSESPALLSEAKSPEISPLAMDAGLKTRLALSVSANPNQLLWLALALTSGLGPTRARRLVEFLGSVESVFNASLTELEAAGLPAQSAQSIGTGRSIELAHDEAAKAGANGIQIVAMDDAEYPSRLRQIYDPPVVLYVRGNVAAVSQPGIAVVGTRHPTPYGMGMAERLGCDLSARGLVIISGLARGVDTFAHCGAISAKGKASPYLAPALMLFIRRKIYDWPIRYSVWAEH
jgi:predicted Rossmann fold nucleotide-binding protein DprA/Smf involved in DNA uptake